MTRNWITPLALTAAMFASAAGNSAAASAARLAAVPTKTIATVTTVDYRAVVVAEKSSEGPAPTARLTVTAYVRAHGHWQRIAERRLAGTFFWKTITGPHSLCGLQLTTAATPAGSQLGVTVEPLASPSIGCGKAERVPFPANS